MTDAQQRSAAKDFIKAWAGRGDEKQDTQTFWIDLLQKVFGADRVYRIGGDEFLAVLEGMGPEAVGGLFAEMDAELAAFNGGEKRYEMPLSISRGTAAYERGRDKQFRDIFRRADEAMYRDKNEFYRRNGGSRKDAHTQ